MKSSYFLLVLFVAFAATGTIKHVRPVTGNDGTGDGGDFSSAYKTVDKGLDNVLAGESLYIHREWNGVDFNITIDNSDSATMNDGGNTSPTYPSPLYVFFVDSLGARLVRDSLGIVTNQFYINSGATTLRRLLYIGDQNDYTYFFDCGWDANNIDTFCVESADNDNWSYPSFIGCTFKNAYRTNLRCRVAGTLTLSGCSFSGAGWNGVEPSLNYRNSPCVVNCSFYDCDSSGLVFGASPAIISNCTFSRNKYSGFKFSGTSSAYVTLFGSTFFKNRYGYKDAAQMIFSGKNNNAFVWNDTAEHTGNSTVYRHAQVTGPNLYYGNTRNIDINSGTPFGSIRTSAPNIKDTALASEDLRYTSPSPCDSGSIPPYYR